MTALGPRLALLGKGFLLAAQLLACGGPSDPDIVVTDLPAYSAEQARLYDDSIAPEVFEEGATPRLDARLKERVLGADVIVPVRLVAINAERSDSAVRYELLTEPTGTPLAGFVGSEPLELWVGRGSPSQAMLKSLDTQLVGAKMLVLARRYQREGRLVLHFRAEPDTLAMRELVQRVLSTPRD